MVRNLDYQKVDDFFKSLAQKHVDIKDYCGTSAAELASKADSTDGIKSPILVFYKYSGRLSGSQKLTFNSRTIAFSILYSGVSIGDPAAILEAKTNAEIIGLEVLSRINVQSQMQDIGWLYNNITKETINYEEVDPEYAEDLVGMDFSFELKTNEPLVVTASKWSDGDIFCTA
ncbi:hypothetical protein AB9T89_10480 [Flavobacterium oncorhynchi]|uniref:hypothetical protein n=1 Tax=Flavobacterium oncorhynchi TaxID=728056 RepID=UPI00351A365A